MPQLKEAYYSGLDEIAIRMGVNKNKAAGHLAEGAVASLVTGGEKRRNYNTTETLISHTEKMHALIRKTDTNPFAGHLGRDILSPKSNKCDVLSIANQKGGVGKTTTAVNLAASLAELGQKVLLVDIDSQAQSSRYLRKKEYNNDSIKNLFEIFQNDGEPTREQIEEKIITMNTGSGNIEIDLLPSEVRLGRTLEVLRMKIRPESMLLQLINKIRDKYDFILIDTPPSASLALQQGIYAADKILLVSEADEFSVTPLEATIEEIELLNRQTEKDVRVDAVLVNQYREREVLQREYMGKIIDMVIGKLNLDEDGLIVVKYASSIVRTSQSLQLPILAYKKKVKEALVVSDPFFKYASKLIIEKITTAVVRGN